MARRSETFAQFAAELRRLQEESGQPSIRDLVALMRTAGRPYARSTISANFAPADCDAAASLLLGSCFQYAFLCCFAGRQPAQGEIDVQAASVVGTLLAGIAAG